LKGGWQPQLPLELALVEVTIGSSSEGSQPPAVVSKPAAVREPPTIGSQTAPEPEIAEQPQSHTEPSPPSQPQGEETASAGLTTEFIRQRWPLVLSEMKTRDRAAQALLNSTYPASVRDGVITLHVDHDFARGKLSQTQTKELVEDVLSQICGQPCRVEFQVAALPADIDQRRATESNGVWDDDPLVQAAKNLGAKVRPISEGSDT
jgi:hypothetical protein